MAEPAVTKDRSPYPKPVGMARVRNPCLNKVIDLVPADGVGVPAVAQAPQSVTETPHASLGHTPLTSRQRLQAKKLTLLVACNNIGFVPAQQ